MTGKLWLLCVLSAGLANGAQISGTKAQTLFDALKRIEARPVVRVGATKIHVSNVTCEKNLNAYVKWRCEVYDRQAVVDLRETLRPIQDDAYNLYNALSGAGLSVRPAKMGGTMLKASEITCTHAVVSPAAARNATVCTIQP